MVVKEQYKILLKDVGKNNRIKNKGILEILENAGAHHSDMVGYGVNSIATTSLAWILLDWKLKVIKRPTYGTLLNTRTWARKTEKVRKTYTYRDFEIYDENNELLAIATSKWAIIDINTVKISRITDEMMEKYKMEEKSVFGIDELDRIKIPEKIDKEVKYEIRRREIDLNGHVHNLNYLDIAYEVLPEDVYEKRPFDNVRIQYKKEIKYGDKIICDYCQEGDKSFVTIYNEDKTIIHAVVVLY